MSTLYAVVNPKGNTIKSKWYKVVDGNLEDVTLQLFSSVKDYNKSIQGLRKTSIPYDYANGYITYSFGCGLTHYLQNSNVGDVTQSDIKDINVWTVSDLKMYTKGNDWENDLKKALQLRGEL